MSARSPHPPTLPLKTDRRGTLQNHWKRSFVAWRTPDLLPTFCRTFCRCDDNRPDRFLKYYYPLPLCSFSQKLDFSWGTTPCCFLGGPLPTRTFMLFFGGSCCFLLRCPSILLISNAAFRSKAGGHSSRILWIKSMLVAETSLNMHEYPGARFRKKTRL